MTKDPKSRALSCALIGVIIGGLIGLFLSWLFPFFSWLSSSSVFDVDVDIVEIMIGGALIGALIGVVSTLDS